jgi:hypothetical protein
MSDRSRSPRGAYVRTEADLDRADLRAALAHASEVGAELADVRAELAAERAALAAARAALAAAEATLATERGWLADERRWSADSRLRWLDRLDTMHRDTHRLAVLARRAGASGDLVEYWYTARTVDEPEPEAEPEPE